VSADPLLNLAFTTEYSAANQRIGSKFMPWSSADGEDLAVLECPCLLLEELAADRRVTRCFRGPLGCRNSVVCPRRTSHRRSWPCSRSGQHARISLPTPI